MTIGKGLLDTNRCFFVDTLLYVVLVFISIVNFDCLVDFLECSDGIVLMIVFIDFSLNILFVLVVSRSTDGLESFMFCEVSLVIDDKGFVDYSSASSSFIAFSKDVWDCWVVELVEIWEVWGGGGNIWCESDVVPWEGCVSMLIRGLEWEDGIDMLARGE